MKYRNMHDNERDTELFKVKIHGYMRDVRVSFPRSLVNVRVGQALDTFLEAAPELQDEIQRLDDRCVLRVEGNKELGVFAIQVTSETKPLE